MEQSYHRAGGDSKSGEVQAQRGRTTGKEHQLHHNAEGDNEGPSNDVTYVLA
eukprot:CAMPEP_0179076758 /NCGR_PEP_ID=MMETSP0796-20121207/34264_1 /TAXON_ID=73915 /ORGANISM="Pyrodinium bahamense, Strain pbaha01" /LENGTH=51 /DNA_ID=CAMNT_0020774017 /DNA_START=6 /DNA_END=161 /DNA_ORIENTATION=+